jgi:hypothetical protein
LTDEKWGANSFFHLDGCKLGSSTSIMSQSLILLYDLALSWLGKMKVMYLSQ